MLTEIAVVLSLFLYCHDTPDVTGPNVHTSDQLH